VNVVALFLIIVSIIPVYLPTLLSREAAGVPGGRP